MASTGATCQSTCQQPANGVIYDNLDGRVNICVSNTNMVGITGAGIEGAAANAGVVTQIYCKAFARVAFSNTNLF